MGWLVADRGGAAGRARARCRASRCSSPAALAYTAGVVFFMLDSRLRYAHAVWHGFVVAGTGCHFFAVLGYAG